MLPYLLVAVALGVATETLAHFADLWRYRSAGLRVANVALMFGLGYGGLAYALAGRGWLWPFLAGAVIGVAYELVNDRILKAWTFPGVRVTWLRGQVAVIGIGIAWGFVPLLILLFRGFVA